MAADTANQKVFVPLQGVLKLQDEVRRVEQEIKKDTLPPSTQEGIESIRQLEAFNYAIAVLGLPITSRQLEFTSAKQMEETCKRIAVERVNQVCYDIRDAVHSGTDTSVFTDFIDSLNVALKG